MNISRAVTEMIFPHEYKYSQIRCVNNKRIYEYLYPLVQNLNPQIVFLADSSLPDYSDTSQEDLGKFNEKIKDDNQMNQADGGNDDSGESENKSETTSSDDDDSPSKKALIYARVSGHKQTSDDSDEETNDEPEETNDD